MVKLKQSFIHQVIFDTQLYTSQYVYFAQEFVVPQYDLCCVPRLAYTVYRVPIKATFLDDEGKLRFKTTAEHCGFFWPNGSRV